MDASLPALHPLISEAASFLIFWLIAGSILRVLYNVHLHPLARFPGPPAAAYTKLWLAYMEVWKGVDLAELRFQLHEKYGDIVRISPNELHFSNPSVYREIYNLRNKWDKDDGLYRAADLDSFFGSSQYPEVKMRRAVSNPFFSKYAIFKMQHLVHERDQNLAGKSVCYVKDGKSSDLYLGFKCFSADAISLCYFGACFEQTSMPEFNSPLLILLEESLPSYSIRKYLNAVVWLVRNFSDHPLMVIFPPSIRSMCSFYKIVDYQTKKIVRDQQQLKKTPPATLSPKLLTPEVRRRRRSITAKEVLRESQVLLCAGSSHVVGSALMTATYHLLQNPEMHQRLFGELLTAWPDLDHSPRYEALERLPFLTAIVKETLRLAPTMPVGLARVIPREGATVSGIRIPGGTVVSQSALFVHLSEDIFVLADDFMPERWLGPDAASLNRFLVAFSTGPRSCQGINLAYCELYLGLAHLFRRFDLRVDETRPASMVWKEHFLPYFTGEHLHVFCSPKTA
ncbi:cytochrome P450 [Gloeopeniophorella convolvens]|nr:cytochrome P450 [Gloeopeniophorella convolvens]